MECLRSGRTACAAIIAAASIAAAAPGGVPVELSVNGRSSANVSMAAGGRFVAAVWGASLESGVTDLYAAVSRDAGATFGAAIRVNDRDGQANLSGEQPPRIALVRQSAGDPAISVVWTAKTADGTVLLETTSRNGGKSFAPATIVAGSRGAGNRGWESVAVDARGRVAVVWLDHREHVPAHPEAAAAPAQHEHPGGVPMAELSKLYFGRLDGSLDGRPVTGGVCYCCKTALAAGADGALYAAWRHVFPGDIRDIAFTVSRDSGRTFAPIARVSDDRWMLQGCPEDGPAIVVDSKNRAHVVWPTLVSRSGLPDAKALFYASSADGQHFDARQRLPTEGTPQHPQLAIAPDGSLAVVWDESSSGARRVVLARFRPGDSSPPRFIRSVLSGSERAVYPAIAATRDGVVTAWTTGTVIRVKR